MCSAMAVSDARARIRRVASTPVCAGDEFGRIAIAPATDVPLIEEPGLHVPQAVWLLVQRLLDGAVPLA